MYFLDELIIGLYFVDVKLLFSVLYEFVEVGNMVLVVEYNFDVIKLVDWVIDFGLEGGVGGG